MKKFEYRYEKVLSFRKFQEKERMRDLAKVRHLEEKQLKELREVLDDREAHLDSEKNHLVGKIDPMKLTAYSRYYVKLKHLELTGREMLKKIGEEVDKKRVVLVEATKQRKIYEKLKERHKDQFDHEYNALVQKETDEIGMRTFVRKK